MPTRPTIVITGASDGIGAEAALALAAQGQRVIVVGRSPEKTARVAERAGAEHLVADFARLDDVRRLAAEIRERVEAIDVLANNAGGVAGPRRVTADGFEATFQINHLAPFLLTHLLMEPLLTGGGAVVNTASAAHRTGRLDLADLGNERRYSPGRAYAASKLANVLHARGLHARFHEQGLSAVAFHPGVVATSFASSSNGFFRFLYSFPLTRRLMVPAAEGGADLAWFLAGEPGRTWASGAYYDKRVLARPAPAALDDELADGLWQRSTDLLGLAH
ncbi:SDR family NAD(P)-dependent oxidoreductase [Pseudactinotalea suaedae]|uniref:SDR family NAD(P)-dependent oxidoreductase n=1 Tax=Pseudactinotalea suaedae TaxID=1524924 RepID=UPI0012E1C310|nr:SDR family NAD(P)-dependent oxidoreductase [Pseudactinotalea suaedae]